MHSRAAAVSKLAWEAGILASLFQGWFSPEGCFKCVFPVYTV